MNIVLFSRSTIDHFTSGGMETHLKNLVEGLAEHQYKVTVITTSHPLKLTEDFYLSRNGVDYIFVKNTTPGFNPLSVIEKLFYKLGILSRGVLEVPGNYFEESNRVYNSLSNKQKIDVVISQSTAAYGVYKELTVPYISIIHGTIKSEIKNRWASLKTLRNYVRFILVDLSRWSYEYIFKNKQFFDKAQKIIAVSQDLKRNFISDFNNLENKVVVIPNGVDENIFKPSTEKFEQFTILFIGRMELEKGVDTILKALKIDKSLPINAIFIGKGIHLDYFKNLSKDLGLQNKVQFLGSIENTKLSEYYSKSHVFVLPSKRVEGHPMTISEAMCSGLPILATNKGGLKELFDNGVEGYFISDEKSLAEKLDLLYNNKEELSKLSDNSLKKGLHSFSKNAMIGKYINCLKGINENA